MSKKLTKRQLTKKETALKYAVKFFEEHGVGYHSFRRWLKKEWDLTMSDIKMLNEVDQFVERFKCCSLSFRDKYGISNSSFYSWLNHCKQLKAGELYEEEYDDYIAEYFYYRIVKAFKKEDFERILTSYITAQYEGSDTVEIQEDRDLILIEAILNKGDAQALSTIFAGLK